MKGIRKLGGIFPTIVLRSVRSVAFVVFLAMLLLNVATLSIAGLNSFISSLIASTWGIETVSRSYRRTSTASAQQVMTLRDQNEKLSRSLRGERRRTKTLQAQFSRLSKKSRLKDQMYRESLQRNLTEQNRFSRKQAAVRQDLLLQTRSLKRSVSATTDAIRRRTVKMAAANFGGIMTESIPVAGIASIVVLTGLEMKTACETLKDIDGLAALSSEEPPTGEDVKTVCGFQVPSEDAVWKAIKESPEAVNIFAGSMSRSLWNFKFPREWSNSVRATVGAEPLPE